MTKNNTVVIHHRNGDTGVILHQTEIVRFNKNRIILNTGGYDTATTKKRMNEVSQEFNLGYEVYQSDHTWYIYYDGEAHKFEYCKKNEEFIIVRK